MSFSKIPLYALGALMLAGCGEKSPNVTIPSGMAIQVQVYELGDDMVGKVLAQKNGETSVPQVLASHDCHLGIPTHYDASIKRKVAATGNLVCNRITTEIKGELFDNTGVVGVLNMLRDDTVTFVVSEAVNVK
ncbi:hypothetical protein D3C81_1016770 [compost metagenome]